MTSDLQIEPILDSFSEHFHIYPSTLQNWDAISESVKRVRSRILSRLTSLKKLHHVRQQTWFSVISMRNPKMCNLNFSLFDQCERILRCQNVIKIEGHVKCVELGLSSIAFLSCLLNIMPAILFFSYWKLIICCYSSFNTHIIVNIPQRKVFRTPLKSNWFFKFT